MTGWQFTSNLMSGVIPGASVIVAFILVGILIFVLRGHILEYVKIKMNFSTKDDIDQLRKEDIAKLDVKIDQLRADTRADMNQLRADTRSDMNQLRADTRADMDALRSDMNQFRTDIRSDVDKLRGEMDQFRTDIRSDMDKLRTDTNTKFDELRSDLRRNDFFHTNKAILLLAECTIKETNPERFKRIEDTLMESTPEDLKILLVR
jgi:cytochrome c556